MNDDTLIHSYIGWTLTISQQYIGWKTMVGLHCYRVALIVPI